MGGQIHQTNVSTDTLVAVVMNRAVGYPDLNLVDTGPRETDL